MKKQLTRETREKLQELLLNPHISSISVEDSKLKSGEIRTVVSIHTYEGTVLSDVKDAISNVLTGRYSDTKELNGSLGIFTTTNILNSECEVVVFAYAEKTPAPTEVPEEIIQSNYTSESEVVANA
ncbi:hypothetical protein E4K67_22655 [Desulfosporosinus fructosivorans]|uniref:Uncharacterized protein n=1 Tax=Desulfosporosinus fructosivorans TaxID=2018669 RepID=A0A4Z0QZN3_9FIRM|nr:hypothetical protein [Desulfosporosinus fructosivorans]TGE35920.1 hypothetical protein E4K67_22655 [Desulfosporosinus fructosivorans]